MTEIQAKFILPIKADTDQLSSERGISFSRWGLAWDQFIKTEHGFGIGIKDCGGETGRVFGIVSTREEEPVVLLTEEAIGVLTRST